MLCAVVQWRSVGEVQSSSRCKVQVGRVGGSCTALVRQNFYYLNDQVVTLLRHHLVSRTSPQELADVTRLSSQPLDIG